MAGILLKGNEIQTSGVLPPVGSIAPNFTLVRRDLSEMTQDEVRGKRVILNIFPSLDTGTCATSVRQFADEDVLVFNISKDLPFAQGRFCDAEGLGNVETLSAFRSSFAQDFGLEIVDGPLKGLCSRAVIVLDASGLVLYREQVPEITQEPNYAEAVKVCKV